MPSLVPYLVFPGTCKEAMQFYADVLGGELTIMTTFADSPLDVPDEVGDRVFNSEIQADGIRIKASDDLPDHEVRTGNSVSLFAVFPDRETQARVFTALSNDGNVLFPIQDNFGMLVDRYGIQWMIVHEEESE